AVSCREGQAPPGQRLHDAEDVCGPAPDVLVIGASQLARRHRLAAPRVFPESDGPLIQAPGLVRVRNLGREGRFAPTLEDREQLSDDFAAPSDMIAVVRAIEKRTAAQ